MAAHDPDWQEVGGPDARGYQEYVCGTCRKKVTAPPGGFPSLAPHS